MRSRRRPAGCCGRWSAGRRAARPRRRWSGTPTGRCRRSPHRGSARPAPRGSPARSGRGRAQTRGSARSPAGLPRRSGACRQTPRWSCQQCSSNPPCAVPFIGCDDHPDPGEPPSPDAGDSSAAHRRGRRASMTGVATALLRRDGLLAALDRSSLRKVTVISAPPGSGKTSLLRAWSDRASKDRRVAFVSVARDQQDAQEFWLAVLEAIRRTDAVADFRPPVAAPEFDGDVIVDTVVSELAEATGVVVLVIDDLHELSSADALSQLEHLLSSLPERAHVVLSSRRDPPIKLHQLRLAGEVAELRASDLRFSANETRELLAASGINLSDAGVAALYERTEGWVAGLRLGV